MTKKMGPKPKITEPAKLKTFMRLKPTIEDTAAFFECSVDTVERFVKKEWGLTFAVFRDQNMVHTRMNLIRTAIQKAERGDNVMLIFCLKNLCGWRDKPVEDSEETQFRNMSTKDLVVFVKQKLPELEESA